MKPTKKSNLKSEDFPKINLPQEKSIEQPVEKSEEIQQTLAENPVEKPVDPAIIKSYESQIKIFLIIIGISLALVFLAYYLSIESKKFTYEGIPFQKGLQGNLVLYLGTFPVSNTQDGISKLNVYFREDPRKLKDIPVPEQINLKQVVGIASESKFVQECEDSILAGTTLSMYLGKIGYNVVSGTLNYNESVNLKRTLMECQPNSQYSVISYQPGNETKIFKIDNSECYVIQSKDCNIMNATERFMMEFYHLNS